MLDELRARSVVRSRNNPTGDYAEWLVTQKLGLKLVANSFKGYDATDRRGRTYQIKGRRAARGQTAPLLGTIRNYEAGDFDFLIAVVFEPNWEVRCAAKIAHGDLREFLKFREHVNGHNMRFSPSIFQDPRVKDISNELRG
ncbi:MAG TPA: hypothetical protein VNT59_01735 [Ramlibacter sp.]|nr:hypothetical protein [Ramlibacter sp.]